jgi:hypothetical protein
MEIIMKDILQDLVAHTHALGFIPLVKISSTNSATEIEAMAEDRSVIVNAKTKSPVSEFEGVFGMPNLNKLAIHLNCPEYKEHAKISVVIANRNGEDIPTGLHFENKDGDFENDYRFMNKAIIEEKLKTVKFKGASWDVTFKPSVASIQRMKLMSAAHSEEPIFTVKTENNNLVFYFGDHSSHAGNFVFAHDVAGSLSKAWSWPLSAVISILSLSGDKMIRFSDEGAAQITVDSGLAIYNYILPAQTK